MGASLVGRVLVAYGIVYVLSEVKLRCSYAVTQHPIAIPHDSASIAPTMTRELPVGRALVG